MQLDKEGTKVNHTQNLSYRMLVTYSHLKVYDYVLISVFRLAVA